MVKIDNSNLEVEDLYVDQVAELAKLNSIANHGPLGNDSDEELGEPIKVIETFKDLN